MHQYKVTTNYVFQKREANTKPSERTLYSSLLFTEKFFLQRIREQTYNECVYIQLFEMLEPRFKAGEYDKVKKICNGIISLLS